MTTDGIPQIIAAAVAGIVLLINTWKGFSAAKIADKVAEGQNKKLDDIHDATNGGWADLKQQLVTANARIEKLEQALVCRGGGTT